MNGHYAFFVGGVAVLVVARFLTGDAQQPAPQLASPKRAAAAHAEVALTRAGDGHFYVEADVNGTNIRMLADTGASLVVLGEAAAESVGINPDTLDFDQTVQTANGTTEAAVVELDEIRVGGIVRRDVQALVTRRLNGALLGMSFFNSLSKVSIESDELVLKD
jgi:aspartyl protease family protein